MDGLRGLAVLAVVLYHFAPGVAPGGFLGVDLFFVLSGFLITSLLVSEWEGTASVSLRSFWARRARRLLPALFLVLAAVAVYALLLSNQVDGQHIAVDGLSALGYVANWHFISSGNAYIQQFLHQVPSPLRHTWSLAIEEQFYLVWPVVVVLVAKLAGRRHGRTSPRTLRRALAVVCLTLGAASLLRMVTLFQSGADPNRVYYGTDTRAFIILAGATLGALAAGAPTVGRSLRGVLITLGVGGMAALVAATAWLTTSSSWLYEGGYGLIAVTAVVVLVAAAQPGVNPLARLLTVRPLVGLGLISYGVYLWHWPVVLWVTGANTGLAGFGLFALRAAVTLGAALTSYFLIELPIRAGRLPRWKDRFAWVGPVMVVTAVAGLLLVPALALPSTRTVPNSKLAAKDVTARYALGPRCDGGGAPAPPPIQSGHHLLVQLEGNSVAGEIRACLGSILRARGASLEGVDPPGFLLCREIPAIAAQVRNPKTRPDAAILLAFVAYDPRCGQPWHWPVDQLIKIWKAAGTHVYLVPTVPFVHGTSEAKTLAVGPELEAAYYTAVAQQDPAHVTLLDAGAFIRDAGGTYAWQMPCLPGGEPGCDSHHTVNVRYIDGLHFCTDPAFAAHGCEGARHQAGERRAAASVATGLIPSLQGVKPGAVGRADQRAAPVTTTSTEPRGRGPTGRSPTPSSSPRRAPAGAK